LGFWVVSGVGFGALFLWGGVVVGVGCLVYVGRGMVRGREQRQQL